MEHLVKSIEDTIFWSLEPTNSIDEVSHTSAILANDIREMAVSFAKYVHPWQDMISYTAIYIELFEEFLEIYYKKN
jgi:hypothetical protein